MAPSNRNGDAYAELTKGSKPSCLKMPSPKIGFFDEPAKIDHISSMPDEVLVCILSLLALEEAAVTSVLSSRWRNLWTFIPMQSLVVAETRTNRCFKSLMKHLTLGTGKRRTALGFHCFKSLISLSFKYDSLTSKAIDNIISHCPRLEHLHVDRSSRLVSVKIAGTHLQLKHLEVYDCGELRKMDIHAPNLVSLRYEGPHIELSLECGHQLVDVFCHIYAGTCKFRVSFLVWQFKPYLSLLKTFTLACNPAEVELSSKMLPTFSNLTELVVFLETENESLLPYALFLKMSPSLQKLELHLLWRKPRNIRKLLRKMEGTNWEHVSEYEPHHLLKEVVLSGFRGLPEDMELSMYLLHNAVSLEKFTIDPYFRMLFGNSWSRTNEKGIPAARKCAELLFRKKPPQVEMYIL